MRSPLRSTLAPSLATLLLLLAPGLLPRLPAIQFLKTVHTVDQNSGPGSSLALGPDGLPRVVYSSRLDNASFESLRHARWNGTAWEVTCFDFNAAFPSVAVDAQGKSHFSFANALWPVTLVDGGVWYASEQDDGSWKLEQIGGDLGWFFRDTSLKLDSAGRPHISGYHQRPPHDPSTIIDSLVHLFHNGSGWTVEVVKAGLNGAQVGKWNALALDGADQPAIAYFDNVGTEDGKTLPFPATQVKSGLGFAAFSGGAWATQMLDYLDASNVKQDYSSGIFVSLAVDGAGARHIAYINGSTGELRYLKEGGTAEVVMHLPWIATSLSGGVESRTSIAVNPDGVPIIAFVDYDTPPNLNTAALKVAYRTGPGTGPGAWQVTTVDSGGAGLYPSLALNGNGDAAIGYYDNLARTLKVAFLRDLDRAGPPEPFGKIEPPPAAPAGDGFCSGGNGRVAIGFNAYRQIADNDGEAGLTAMVLDSQDQPRLASGTSFRYGSWGARHWSLELLDTPAAAMSLALDSLGRPNALYVDPDHRRLRFARQESPGWSIQTLTVSGEIYPSTTALAIDGGDGLHLSCYQLFGAPCAASPRPGGCDSDLLNNFKLLYAHSTDGGASWQEEIVDRDPASPEANGKWSSLVLDSHGSPVIAYSGKGNGTVKLARRGAGGGWTSQTVFAGSFVSLRLNDSDLARVAFIDYAYMRLTPSSDLSRRRINLARETAPGVWEKEVVAGFFSPGQAFADDDDGFNVSLRLDPAGEAWVSYQDPVLQALRISRQGANGWESIESAALAGQISGRYSSLALDRNSNPIVSYFNRTNRGIEVAYVVNAGAPWDADGDGIYDLLDSCPGAPDCDGDGLPDASEDMNRNGQLDPGETDPSRADTDSDGVPDGAEAALGTSPTSADTDGDGLKDGAEAPLSLDPLHPDADGDGWADGVEVYYGTNPASAGSIPPHTILFQADFTPGSRDLDAWGFFNDPGLRETPAIWAMENDELIQKSNAYGITLGGAGIQPGTYAIAGQSCWREYDLVVRYRSADDDLTGIVFRFLDEQNFFLLSLAKNRRTAQIWKRASGIDSRLAAKALYCYDSTYHEVIVKVTGSSIQVFFDNLNQPGTPFLEATDPNLSAWAGGRIGFYSSMNQGSAFDSIKVLKRAGYIDTCSTSGTTVTASDSTPAPKKQKTLGYYLGCSAARGDQGPPGGEGLGVILLNLAILASPFLLCLRRRPGRTGSHG